MICSNFRKSAWCYTVSSCYTVPKSAPFYAVACVADALNLLHIADYTKGLDECVGRLQRRLLCSRHKKFRLIRICSLVYKEIFACTEQGGRAPAFGGN